MSETGNGRYLPLLPSRLLRSATKSTNGDVTEANYPMKRVMTSALAVGAVVGAASLMVPATASAAPGVVGELREDRDTDGAERMGEQLR